MNVIDQLEESAGEVPLREVGRVVSLQAEKEMINEALRRTDWNRKQAAKLLHVSYKTLFAEDSGLWAEPRLLIFGRTPLHTPKRGSGPHLCSTRSPGFFSF